MKKCCSFAKVKMLTTSVYSIGVITQHARDITPMIGAGNDKPMLVSGSATTSFSAVFWVGFRIPDSSQQFAGDFTKSQSHVHAHRSKGVKTLSSLPNQEQNTKSEANWQPHHQNQSCRTRLQHSPPSVRPAFGY
jgi:hypothetical protein